MQVAYIDREDKVRDNDDVKLQSTKYEATSAIGRDRRQINVSLYKSGVLGQGRLFRSAAGEVEVDDDRSHDN